MSIVFISYSHDSDTHRERVLGLSERLRSDGFETRLDQYVNGAPLEKWHRWMLDRLDEADFVLVVCTATYYRRFRGHEEPGRGKGVDFEGALITQEIYDARSKTLKFVPVLFAPEDEKYIPEPLRGHTHYTLTSEASYEALHDFLRDQAGVEPGPVGEPRRKERRRGAPLTFDEAPNALATGSERIAPSRLRHGAARLFGREEELADLDAAWSDPTTNVLSIVAWGGVGKTSLVATWAARLARRGYDAARYFDWSFYSQGTRDQTSASSDAFIAKALEFFGDAKMADSPASPWDKGTRLAQLVAQERTLLVLDGLEPMQYPPGPLAGELRDPALAALLRGLAQRNPGLCVVTTRERVADLISYRDTTAPEWKLEHLPVTAGADLLRSLGVHGTQAEIEQLVTDVKGHALTVNLLGSFLARAHGGDVRKRDLIQFEEADEKLQGGHAFKAIAAYERWLSPPRAARPSWWPFKKRLTQGELERARQLAILRLLGLFDRPADAGCLAALRGAPAIAGLTDLLIDLREDDWNLAVTSLADSGLVAWGDADTPKAVREAVALDAHPLIREYFGTQLRRQKQDAWRAAHSRLCNYLRDNTEPMPDTLAGLQPLYQAVAHGCQAERHQEVYDHVYNARIQRHNEFYSTNKLGALGANLGAVACFFDHPWSLVSPVLSEFSQTLILYQAAYHLRALGRVNEASKPFQVALQRAAEGQIWYLAAVSAGALSELQLTLGEVGAAIATAEKAVEHAQQSNEKLQHLVRLTTLASALHQAGRRDDALTLFRKAEEMQAQDQPEFPLLYSYRGFQYCDLLLASSERDAWRAILATQGSAGLIAGNPVHYACDDVFDRVRQTFEWVVDQGSLLDVAFDHLTLCRAALYKMHLPINGAAPHADNNWNAFGQEHIGAAVNSLRRAGMSDELPRGLLTRACLKALEGDTGTARADLDEAWEIAERGPMRLHMADIHLYRARLFHAVKPYPWSSPQEDIAAARKLIEQCGYWRRKEELEDAEAAAEHW